MDVFDSEMEIPDLDFCVSPFAMQESFIFKFDAEADDPLPFLVRSCDKMYRAFIFDIQSAPMGQSKRTFKKHIVHQ